MTLLTVQLIMGGLGLITGLLIALFGPGKRWIRWPLAIATGVGVAITAWPGLWLVESGPNRQLFQSLLLAAVVVLMALLAMIMLYPRQRYVPVEDQTDAVSDVPEVEPAEAMMNELSTPKEAGRDAIRIDLEDNPDAIIATQQEHALMHLLGSGKNTDATSESEHPDFEAETQRVSASTADVIALVPEPADQSASTADVVSLAERRELREGEAAADALDLSDSEDLYLAMRDAEAELELPVDSTWLNDEPDTELEVRESLDEVMDEYTSNDNDADIEDAEILNTDEDMLLFNDATTADLPVSEEYESSQEDLIASDLDHYDENEHAIDDDVPATLGAALTAQRRSIEQLSQDTDTLATRLTEWRDLANNNEQVAWASSLQQRDTLDRQHERIVAENNFRQAAVELIHTQRDVMKQLMRQIGSLGEQHKDDLATLTALQENAVTQRRLAREAALLARKAAADKQSISSRLIEEQRKHERTQSAAQRAMAIARDAVDKLAEHERRLGSTESPKTPDSQS